MKKKKIVKFKDDELDVNASTVEETIWLQPSNNLIIWKE